jgi:esterase
MDRPATGHYSTRMDLAFRALGGEGGPIVILHGLFGSSQNWVGMGRKLSSLGTVYAVDLRNHGDSPHTPSHSLADCVQDLVDWAQARGLQSLRLIGHSMGGLVAMAFAIAHAELAEGVATIDIAPRPYPPEHGKELLALKTDISACRTRADVDQLLLPIVPDTPTRQFLLTNAVRDGQGFAWRLNVSVLEKSSLSSDWGRVTGTFEKEALLVAGGKSSYVRAADHAVMRRFFPRARIETIAEADHWPHVTAPAHLEALLRGFLQRCAINGPDPRLQ